jgi:bacillithiol synthase
VVTGQQIGWLLGPTFALSKAVTAIRLARALDREDRPVVPIFWMATQDHDVEEMDHAWLLGRDEQLTRLALPMPAARRRPRRSTRRGRGPRPLRALDGDGPHAEM